MSYNSWPDGHKHAMAQCEHEAWNASNYPGTKQLCELCDEPTGSCEEDHSYLDDGTGPVCPECYVLQDGTY